MCQQGVNTKLRSLWQVKMASILLVWPSGLGKANTKGPGSDKEVKVQSGKPRRICHHHADTIAKVEEGKEGQWLIDFAVHLVGVTRWDLSAQKPASFGVCPAHPPVTRRAVT